MTESLFLKQLVGQLRALDTYGTWEKHTDEALLAMKYIKTKEELKEIPIIGDISEVKIKEIRMVLQALALAFEVKTGVMATVVFEMNHEGFGRGVVIAEGIVVVDKSFRDAHRFFYPTHEKLAEEGEKLLAKAVETYTKKRG